MRRFILGFIFALLLMIAPATKGNAVEMLLLPITTATGPAVSPTFQIRRAMAASDDDDTGDLHLGQRWHVGGFSLRS
jgi:hypothetical protein